MIHHIATTLLLVYSYYVNFTRVGVMVLLVHDMSDIFLEAAKLCRCVLIMVFWKSPRNAIEYAQLIAMLYYCIIWQDNCIRLWKASVHL
jgi:hypothetical protein